jgi:hypothetical protein
MYGFPNSVTKDVGSAGASTDIETSLGSPSLNSAEDEELELLKQLQQQQQQQELQYQDSSHPYSPKTFHDETNRQTVPPYVSPSGSRDDASTLDEESTQRRGEQQEQRNISEMQRMMVDIPREQRRQLTYSLRPNVGPKFDPSATRWEGRHHMTVSTHNSTLHATHRDFFDSPQAFDMLTKPRCPLEKDPIITRLKPKPYDDGMATLIFKKSSGSGKKANGGGSRRLPTSPVSRLAQRKQPGSAGSVHSDSYLQPFALAKKTTGNALYVPASFSL